jgi:hypothetical protein
MKKIKMTVDKQGNVNYDLLEGYSGMSCEQKAKGIEVLVAGISNSETHQKPEYFEDNGDEMIDIFTGK